MWIKLTSAQVIDVNGKPTRFLPGDWVDVGKQYALRLVTQGLAIKPNENIVNEMVDYTSGMLVIGNELTLNQTKQIQETIPDFEIKHSENISMPFSETVIYDRGLSKLRVELLPIGFHWLNQFQLLAPLADYTTLACHIGTEADQEFTQSIIRELRVPIYDTRLLFIRRSEETLKFIDVWKQYEEKLTDDRLAFLCALYETKPIHLALPDTWIK
jgi:hypothetical protein